MWDWILPLQDQQQLFKRANTSWEKKVDQYTVERGTRDRMRDREEKVRGEKDTRRERKMKRQKEGAKKTQRELGKEETRQS